MAEAVIMPKLGFNMSEGQLIKWYKHEGEAVEKGEPLFEIMTDKTSIEIEATLDGILRKVFIQEGEKVPVTVTIAIIGSENEDISALVSKAKQELKLDSSETDSGSPAETEASNQPEQVSALENTKNYNSGETKLTPRALKFANEKGLSIDELAAIKGSGFEGGITERDIRRYLEEKEKIKATPVARNLARSEGVDLKELSGTGAQQKIMKADVEKAISEVSGKGVQQEAVQLSTPDKEVLKTIPYSGMRKVIGDRLSQSKFSAPHVYFTVSVDVSALQSIRETVKTNTEQKVSMNTFIAAAVGRTLENHPMINASLAGDEIILYKSINLGIAVAVEGGLIVPVVKNVQNKKLTDIAAETERLINKARSNELMPDDYSGGTFTISNLGMYGIEQFTAIINPPETAILAVSGMQKTPAVVTEEGEDKVVVRPLMKLTLSADHRVIDGAAAAEFLRDLKEMLENPMKILI